VSNSAGDPAARFLSIAISLGAPLLCVANGRFPNPDTTFSSFAYDGRVRRTSASDQNGKVTSYAYDDADRLTSVTDAAQNVTTYAYDVENNLTSITDAAQHTTSFVYDAFGRVTHSVPLGYSAIRPRYGPGARTAVIAAFAWWFIVTLGDATWCSFGFFPASTVIPLMIGTSRRLFLPRLSEPSSIKSDTHGRVRSYFFSRSP